MEDYNILNNQFTFAYYLNKNYNSSAIKYALGEKLDIDYIGFISFDNIVITTNIERRADNGFRLIICQNNKGPDTIIDNRRFNNSYFFQLDINYNNLNIKISKQYTNLVNIIAYLQDIKKNIPSYNMKYSLTYAVQSYFKNINNHFDLQEYVINNGFNINLNDLSSKLNIVLKIGCFHEIINDAHYIVAPCTPNTYSLVIIDRGTNNRVLNYNEHYYMYGIQVQVSTKLYLNAVITYLDRFGIDLNKYSICSNNNLEYDSLIKYDKDFDISKIRVVKRFYDNDNIMSLFSKNTKEYIIKN